MHDMHIGLAKLLKNDLESVTLRIVDIGWAFTCSEDLVLLDRELYCKTIENKTIEQVDNVVYCFVSPITQVF